MTPDFQTAAIRAAGDNTPLADFGTFMGGYAE